MEYVKVNTMPNAYEMGVSDFVDQVAIDYLKQGYTLKQCPVCGNAMTKIGTGNSYTIKCKTDGCIKEGYRGL